MVQTLLLLLPTTPGPTLLFLARVMRILDMQLVGRNFFEPAQATVLQRYRWVLGTSSRCTGTRWGEPCAA